MRRILGIALGLSSWIAATAPASGQTRDVAGAVALFEAGRLSAAKEAFKALAQARAHDAVPPTYLGRIALTQNDPGEAADWLERAVALDDTSSLIHTWLARAYGGKAERSRAFGRVRYARRLRDELLRAVELDPANAEARSMLVDFYVQAPGLMGGSRERAEAQLAELRRRDPWRAYASAIRLHRRDHDMAAVEREQLARARDFPDSAQARFELGLLYAELEQYSRAATVLEPLASATPPHRAALYQLGRIGAISGERLDRAEWALVAYVRGASTDDKYLAAAHWRLGMIYERLGDPAHARTEYENSLMIDPTDTSVIRALRRLR